jgi:hypothetical protein
MKTDTIGWIVAVFIWIAVIVAAIVSVKNNENNKTDERVLGMMNSDSLNESLFDLEEGDTLTFIHQYYTDHRSGVTIKLNDTVKVTAKDLIPVALSGGPSYKSLREWNDRLEERVDYWHKQYKMLEAVHKNCK